MLGVGGRRIEVRGGKMEGDFWGFVSFAFLHLWKVVEGARHLSSSRCVDVIVFM